jgi:hypothetical protein
MRRKGRHLRPVGAELQQRVRVAPQVVGVAGEKLRVRERVRLQLLAHQRVALLLLEVHCKPDPHTSP